MAKDNKQWLFNRAITKYENVALNMLKPFNVETMRPKVIQVKSQDHSGVWNYWRCAISGELQAGSIAQGRTNRYFVMDETSGGILGVFALGDPPMMWPYLEQYLGWGWDTLENGTKYQTKKWEMYNRVFYMHRCLPIYEFGQLTGGKLIALLATSQELLRSMELQYSFKLAAVAIRTLHGKSSQYNRLHTRGIEYIGTDDSDRGMYFLEVRKQGIRFLKGEKDRMGAMKCHSFADQFAHWHERWGLPRCQHVGAINVTPDPSQYILSQRLVSGGYNHERAS